MSLTGLPLLVLVAVAATALPVLAVLGWRWRRLRVTRTAALLVCGQLLFGLALGLAVNRQQDFFTSWSDLLGRSVQAHATPVRAGQWDGRVAARAANTSPDHGVVVSMRIPGAHSGIDLPAEVYLPARYSQPAWRHRRFPVIEVLDGFPGSPQRWVRGLRLAQYLDAEIAAGRMAPTVAVLPEQTRHPWQDTECVNAVRGAQFGTYLTRDVRAVISARFRVLTDRRGWGLLGYSTGGFCANNLALQPGYRYAAAASLSGYFVPYQDSSTGNLFRGDQLAREANDPLYQATHTAGLPGISFYAACASPDPQPCREAREFAAATARGPLRTTVVRLPDGGHNAVTWRVVEAPALDWLSGQLSPPLAAPTVPGSVPKHRPAPPARPGTVRARGSAPPHPRPTYRASRH